MTNTRFLNACRRQPVDATPVWFMRQAGRYMPEYRALRERHSLLELCREPELATQVTMQPVNRIDLDAAILFSDLLLPLEPMGLPFDFIKGEGPAIETPIRTTADIDKLTARLTQHLRSLIDPALRNLAECFLIDAEFMENGAATTFTKQ